MFSADVNNIRLVLYKKLTNIFVRTLNDKIKKKKEAKPIVILFILFIIINKTTPIAKIATNYFSLNA